MRAEAILFHAVARTLYSVKIDSTPVPQTFSEDLEWQAGRVWMARSAVLGGTSGDGEPWEVFEHPGWGWAVF